MAKLTVQAEGATETPSQAVVAKAMESFIEVDSAGRKLTIRKPGVLAQFRLIEALGPATAANETYVNMVLPLIYLAAINDEQIPTPTSKLQVEALIQRLDTHGLAALLRCMQKEFGVQDPDADKAAVKN